MRRPRVHHAEGGVPVYDGAECFALAPDGGRLGVLLAQLHPGGIDWPGYFRAGGSPHCVYAGWRAAFNEDLRGTEMGDYLEGLGGR